MAHFANVFRCVCVCVWKKKSASTAMNIMNFVTKKQTVFLILFLHCSIRFLTLLADRILFWFRVSHQHTHLKWKNGCVYIEFGEREAIEKTYFICFKRLTQCDRLQLQSRLGMAITVMM